MRALFLGTVLFACVSLTAETVVTLERDGHAVTAGEVCWSSARSAENPFERWLVSQKTTCSAPGTLRFPADSGMCPAASRGRPCRIRSSSTVLSLPRA